MDQMCGKCKIRKSQNDPKAMYPDFCRECAREFQRILDKHGLLNKLKKKKKVK
jgi:hypothetical protein